MGVNQFFCRCHHMWRHANAGRESNLGLKPKLGFTIGMSDVDVRSGLFSREEKHPERTITAYGGRHQQLLIRQFTWGAVTIAIGLLFMAGCGRSGRESPASGTGEENLPSFANQVQDVRDGKTRRIEATEPLSLDQWDVLAGAVGLEELVVAGGGLDDAAAERLTAFSSLTKLVARQSPLTDAGFAAVARCTSLRDINLPHAACTAEGVKALAALPNLRSLRLGGEHLTGAAVCEAVVSLPKLRFLHLIDVEIGDAGLAVLERRPDLWSLYLDAAGVSDEAWGRYFHVCPNVHVHLDQAHHDRDPGADHHE